MNARTHWLTTLALALFATAPAMAKSRDLADIRIRDPYVVAENEDGTMELVRLNPDLSVAAGEPTTNRSPEERARFFKLRDTGDTLELVD